MNNTYSNPCSRCGKERIISKKWEAPVGDYVGAAMITHIEKICPDPKCQKIVDAELHAQQQKKDNLRKKSEERALARRAQKDYMKSVDE